MTASCSPRFIAGREIEFSVLEHANGDITVSLPGEIAPAESHGFYSYEAKYVDEAVRRCACRRSCRRRRGPTAPDARQTFKALGCGMARVDCLMPDMTFVVNELNTIPASPISACTPRRWRHRASAMPRSSMS